MGLWALGCVSIPGVETEHSWRRVTADRPIGTALPGTTGLSLCVGTIELSEPNGPSGPSPGET